MRRTTAETARCQDRLREAAFRYANTAFVGSKPSRTFTLSVHDSRVFALLCVATDRHNVQKALPNVRI